MFGIHIFLIAGLSLSLMTAEADDAAPQDNIMKMEGGTVIDDRRFFAETVTLLKKKDASDAKGEAKCIGVIFSSVVIFTSMLCEITDGNKNLWMVDPVKKTNDVTITKVQEGRDKTDYKKVDLAVPGLLLSETNTGDSAIPAPFNQNPDDHMESNVIVFAFGDQVKACTVKVLMDNPDECKKLYKEITTGNPNLGLPSELNPHIYCAVKGEDKMNMTVLNVANMIEVDAGTPCDDSLGSPVVSDRMVFGVVIGAFCGSTKVALIQPSFKGLSLESYTEKEEEEEKITDDENADSKEITQEDAQPEDSDTNNIKNEKNQRNDKVIPVRQRNPRNDPKSYSTTNFNHLQVCSMLILGAFALP